MNYLVSENIVYSENQMTNATSKAREDVKTIAHEIGFIEAVKNAKVNRGKGIVAKLENIECLLKNWTIFSTKYQLKRNDVLLIQYPMLEKNKFLKYVLQYFRHKGIKVVFLIHDLNFLRFSEGDAALQREIQILDQSFRIISHNERMTELLCENGITRNKVTELQIFDYLLSQKNSAPKKRCEGVSIAGNLSKAKYIQFLPENVQFYLYGNGEYEKKDNLEYCGAYHPDELPRRIKGKYGLVWDGDSVESCKGSMGEYLLYNNPHKTSLYLVSGIPVIVWKKAAIASFIETNHCGIAVDSLSDLDQVLEQIGDEEYVKMSKKASEIAEKLSSGFYLKNAINKCLSEEDTN